MRLIDADALRRNFIEAENNMSEFAFDNCFPYWKFSTAITNAPTINPDDLRPRGRWITHSDGTTECSECHTLGSPQWKCCPVCTALMDGKEKL